MLERVGALNGATGIEIDGELSGSGTSIAVTVADSVIDNNGDGILAGSAASHAPVKTMVRNTVTSNNGSGIVTLLLATLYLGHSTISGNGTALVNASGTLASYGDNNIDGNGSLGASPSAVAFH